MPQDQYFTVQAIYRGWWMLGLFQFGALIANLALAVTIRHQRGPFVLALLTFFCIAGTLAIFFTWTFPANQATGNWTVVPEN